MKDRNQQSGRQFSLEALEPRIMLSGDGLEMMGVSASAIYESVSENDQEPSDTNHDELAMSGEGLYEGSGEELFNGIPMEQGEDVGETLSEGEDELGSEQGNEQDAVAEPAAPDTGNPSGGLRLTVQGETPENEFSFADEQVDTLHAGQGPPENGLLTVNPGMRLEGTGFLSGSVVNNGIVAPGNSPGIIEIDGDYESDNGVLEIEIGGTTPGTEHDQLTISGSATLNGRLDLLFINDFVPEIGSTYDIMLFENATGGFSTITGGYTFARADRWVQVNILSDRIQLETKEFSFPDSPLGDYSPGLLIQQATSAVNNAISTWLNRAAVEASSTIPDAIDFVGELGMDNIFEVSGNMGISFDTDSFQIVGQDVSFTFGTPETLYASTTEADFGFKFLGDAMALELSALSPTLSGGSFASMSAGSLSLLINTSETAHADEVSIGAASYTFGLDASDRFELEVLDFEGSLAGVLSLGGSLQVSVTNDAEDTFTLLASGANLSAELNAGDAQVALTEGSFGLWLETNAAGDSLYALYAGGTAGMNGVTGVALSGTISVWANNTGSQIVDLGLVGEVDFGTTDTYLAFRGTELSLAIDGFTTLGGDLTFVLEQGENMSLVISGENLNA
ncbi:MAG: LEPR-XLL domain-containing protein, partial [Kiritimatiellae bacterium]|nr:LEPR-XLL domain-containing protein [Kiritimatiellia bacterium]